ncbi:MAG: L-seryl-tRNA(Sec) selenium transferase [Vicinamibacterales bacterium]
MTGPRTIPSIEQLRQRPGMRALEEQFGRKAVIDALRAEADLLRTHLREEHAGRADDNGGGDGIERRAAERLRTGRQLSLRRVINATGVILHTNLGRAPLGAAAAHAVVQAATSYTNLEYDVELGARGRRDVHAERLLCDVTGAESACVVNNNAAATLLTLAALATGREVIVSRGELVEIGGGFRVPDVMAQSGAVLREVGTTNRTRAADYGAAISDRTALILRVHPSNFRIAGFTERPDVGALVALGRRFSIPVVEDIGSGYLDPSDIPALKEEPSVKRSLRDGVDLVMFSGDKLLGGPQAGIIAGRRSLLERVRRHPLMRALRVDKMTYAALEGTLDAYASGRTEQVPVLQMMKLTREEIDARAQKVVAVLDEEGIRATLVDGESTIGGGSAPGATLPTRLIELGHERLSASAIEARLRALDPPVIARIQSDHVVLDLRTIFPADDTHLATLLITVLR